MTQPEIEKLEVGQTLLHLTRGEGSYTYYCEQMTRMCGQPGWIMLDFNGEQIDVMIEDLSQKEVL